MNINAVQRWLPVCLWSAFLLFMATGTGSPSQTGWRLQALIVALFGRPAPLEFFEVLHVFIRKLAHLTAYGTEGGLAWRATGGLRSALGIALAVAVADELIQSITPGRTGMASDVLLDMVGAFTVVWLLWRRRVHTQIA